MSPARRALQPTASVLDFFGAELRHWRNLRGLSQDQLAAKVLHSKDLICKIEKADRRPAKDLAGRLDDILDTGGVLRRLHELVEAHASGPRAAHPGRRCVAVCGSRAAGTDPSAIDEAVRGLARLTTTMELDVRHGPVGIGIEVVTFAADHYRRDANDDGYDSVVAVLGRPNVVRDVYAVVVVGGGAGTRDEVDLATAARVPVIPLAATGGVARRTYARMERDGSLRGWIGEGDFAALASCLDADTIAETVGRLLVRCRRDPISDRPYTVLRCAMSVDGYAGDATGARLLLSGDGDLDRVDAVRASVDAILVDSATLPRDGDLDPSTRNPTRIVYGPRRVVDRIRERLGDAAMVIDAGGRLSLDAALCDLSERGVRRLLIEGGGEASSRFLAQDLVDEIRLVVAPLSTGTDRPARLTGGTTYPFSPSGRMSLAGVEHRGEHVLLRYLLAPAVADAAART